MLSSVGLLREKKNVELSRRPRDARLELLQQLRYTHPLSRQSARRQASPAFLLASSTSCRSSIRRWFDGTVNLPCGRIPKSQKGYENGARRR